MPRLTTHDNFHNGGYTRHDRFPESERNTRYRKLPHLHLCFETFTAESTLAKCLEDLVFDHFGLLGVAEHPVTAVRLLGVLLLLGGVVLIRF